MKNEQLQAMGVTPWLGDTRVQYKGGKAAKRTLTDLCREARAVRDECRGLRDEAVDALKLCQNEHAECLKAVELVGYMRTRMRRDLVRLAWLAGGLSLVNVAVWFAVVLH